MTKLSEFVAFKAAIELLHDTRKEYIINEVYKNAKAQEQKPKEKIVNYVKIFTSLLLHSRFLKKISEIVTPHGINSK